VHQVLCQITQKYLEKFLHIKAYISR